MAKPKFNLSANPTFKAKVAIPVPGGKPADIEFTFKHRSKDALKEFMDDMKEKEDVDLLQDLVSGWDIDDPFNAESLDRMIQNYPGSALAIYQAYMVEMSGARAKN